VPPVDQSEEGKEVSKKKRDARGRDAETGILRGSDGEGEREAKQLAKAKN